MFHLSYTLTHDDFRHLSMLVANRSRALGQIGPAFVWANQKYRWSVIVVAVSFGATILAILQMGSAGWIPDAAETSIALLVGFLFGTILMTIVAFGGRFELTRADGPLTTPCIFTATDDGVSVQLSSMHAQYGWHAIESVSDEADYVVLWLEPCLTELVPDRAFASIEQRTAFLEFVRARLAPPSTASGTEAS